MERRDFVVGAPVALLAAMAARGAAQSPPEAPRGAKPRVVVVVAHPADFCSRSGGTLIKYVRAGCAVKIIWLSRGETDESQTLYTAKPGISVEEVGKIRELEALAAAKVVGAEGRMMGFADNPIRTTDERIEMLAKEMADFKATLILTHWKNEVTYPSHWITGQSAIQAGQIAHVPWNIHFFEPNIGTATRVGFIPDHHVDITEVFDQKIEALKQLPTQPNLVEQYTACARWRGLEAGCRYAEAFVRWAPKPVVEDLLD
jgi:4-oxalomesaconate hydratase